MKNIQDSGCLAFPPLLSEKLFMDMADHLVSDGFKDAGYVYVNIDVS